MNSIKSHSDKASNDRKPGSIGTLLKQNQIDKTVINDSIQSYEVNDRAFLIWKGKFFKPEFLRVKIRFPIYLNGGESLIRCS